LTPEHPVHVERLDELETVAQRGIELMPARRPESLGPGLHDAVLVVGGHALGTPSRVGDVVLVLEDEIEFGPDLLARIDHVPPRRVVGEGDGPFAMRSRALSKRIG
jgi:hypothetical protein